MIFHRETCECHPVVRPKCGHPSHRWAAQDHDTFMAILCEKNLFGMERGVTLGWWPSYDTAPHPWPYAFVVESQKLRRQVFHSEYGFALWETVKELDITSLDQLLHAIGLFPSVSQARKTGHHKSLVSLAGQELWFNRRTVHLFIESD